MHQLRLRVAGGLAVAIALVAGLPSSAAAGPGFDSCAAYRGFSYAMPIPDEMRKLGVHHVDWHISFIDETGTPQSLDTESQITTDVVAAIYQGNVLLRLFSNWGQLPGHDIDFGVATIRPEQAASLYVVSSFLQKTPNADTDATSVRIEGAPGVWSDWIALPRAPERSLCQEAVGGLFMKDRGWSRG